MPQRAGGSQPAAPGGGNLARSAGKPASPRPASFGRADRDVAAGGAAIRVVGL